MYSKIRAGELTYGKKSNYEVEKTKQLTGIDLDCDREDAW